MASSAMTSRCSASGPCVRSSPDAVRRSSTSRWTDSSLRVVARMPSCLSPSSCSSRVSTLKWASRYFSCIQEGMRATTRSDESVQRDVDERRTASGDERTQGPDALQREVMAELAITFDGDAYHLGSYRYTRLDDAVNYARLLRTQGDRKS